MDVLHYTRISPQHRVWHAVVSVIKTPWEEFNFARCGVEVRGDAEKRAEPPEVEDGFLCASCARYLEGDRPIEERRVRWEKTS